MTGTSNERRIMLVLQVRRKEEIVLRNKITQEEIIISNQLKVPKGDKLAITAPSHIDIFRRPKGQE